MKYLTLIAALVFGLAAQAEELSGHAAPGFTIASLDGSKIDLAQLKGKVVYLDFWASWCGPCRKSFPWMQEMQKKYGAQGLQVVAVNLDQEASERDAFMKKLGFTPSFQIGLDPQGKVAENYRVKGMPSSYLIDANGITKLEHPGFREETAPKIESAIKTALGAPCPEKTSC